MSYEHVEKELEKLKRQRNDTQLLISVYKRKLDETDARILELEAFKKK